MNLKQNYMQCKTLQRILVDYGKEAVNDYGLNMPHRKYPHIYNVGTNIADKFETENILLLVLLIYKIFGFMFSGLKCLPI